jgi:hypothetical protein
VLSGVSHRSIVTVIITVASIPRVVWIVTITIIIIIVTPTIVIKLIKHITHFFKIPTRLPELIRVVTSDFLNPA